MSLITASNLTKSYGAQDVFAGVSVAIPHHARIALVGPNGVGKTTLLGLLAGFESPDQGMVHRARDLRIGYLPQEARYSRRRAEELEATLWEICLGAFEELRVQERELARLEVQMSDPDQAEAALQRYGALQEAFELAGGYTYPARIERTLNGLGFDGDSYDRPFEALSGGEQTRALLAELLLESPDLLIMDEPTNHLDVSAVEWLEKWLKDWEGAAVVVSHDRYFLDKTVSVVWELSSSGVEIYRGNYTAYANQREARIERQEKRYAAQQEHIQKEREFIRRNIAGQNTRQAQGRRTRLQRLLREQKVEAPEQTRSVQFAFPPASRSGDRVLVTHDLAIGHRDAPGPLFTVPDLILLRGECVALMGPNGSGKTTFLQTILGERPAYSGRADVGASLEMGYFVQAHRELDPGRSVLEELMTSDENLDQGEARGFLGRFLFTGEEVFKLVADLSGGERGRLALAKLARTGANLLLLDEPTNHLDIPSQEVLQAALEAFEGTIVLVSHDRYLINALATQMWVIEPASGRMEVYRGGYDDYLEARRAEAAEVELAPSKPSEAKERSRTGERGPSAGERRRALDRLEAEIAALERDLEVIARSLTEAGDSLEEVRELGERYAELEGKLERRLGRWERLAREDYRA